MLWGLPATFLKFAILHWIAAAAVLILGIETKGKTLEELTA